MEPWYKVAIPREEVRAGRSFNPDEFAIALEQVVAGTAPEDYRDPAQFFSRTCWTRALREHVGMVLRRHAGQTVNTAPVLTLVTQFGGGKTHSLATLYHLVRAAKSAPRFEGVKGLLEEAGLSSVPEARVAVFVGNAWDPQPGRENPWIDLARQIAGDRGAEALGPSSLTSAPGTETIGRVFAQANAPVLLLFDEVLNFLNRHRGMAEPFHAFLQNLTVATTATTHGAAVISLPRSQVEMTDWDHQWQERITKIVRRVARDLIANDETEISEVVRRRLFEDLGSPRTRAAVARNFAEWCFERRAQLPPEWTAVDTAATEARAKEFLRARFEACYPFHPATLSVFQRKWQALPQYQQTRGTLAMLAQWIAWAYREGFTAARREPLITLGSAPLEDLGFRSTILGQLGEARLGAAIEADIAGDKAHARALDAGTKGSLRDIHRRVGATILFESSGGQTEKVAHLPELRFALGEPRIDTTSVDNAAFALEAKAYFIRRVGKDGFRIAARPTLKKVVNDRRASLDEATEVRPAVRKLVETEFRRGAALPIIFFPEESTDVPDSPKLQLIVLDPDEEGIESPSFLERVRDWSERRGESPRRYPAALVWCVKKSGRELRERVETWLAWRRVAREMEQGLLKEEIDQRERSELQARVRDAEEAARDEVWAGYRFVIVASAGAPDGLQVIDLGSGHSSAAESLAGRVLAALRSEGLVNDEVGASYIERKWPEAFRESGAWPLVSLRQSFLDGSLTRLVDPEDVLRRKIAEFVRRGDFGLASEGQGELRVWFREEIAPEEVVFEPGVYLWTGKKAAKWKSKEQEEDRKPDKEEEEKEKDDRERKPEVQESRGPVTVRISGRIPTNQWNQVGLKLVSKIRRVASQGASTGEPEAMVEFSVVVPPERVDSFMSEIENAVGELDLGGKVKAERR
ncbi:MAG: hypothetical protein KatS3mg076_0986 [Candidatus Binatia bacterium]|nr:MAG: hypothetical protein KatS3mg076_0986 [Candidatus Binatia bacterium]